MCSSGTEHVFKVWDVLTELAPVSEVAQMTSVHCLAHLFRMVHMICLREFSVHFFYVLRKERTENGATWVFSVSLKQNPQM